MLHRSASIGGLRFFFRPKWRLNGAGSLVLKVGKDTRPINDAPFSTGLSLPRFFKFALGIAHASALYSINLRV
jgi:hypothetical protein